MQTLWQDLRYGARMLLRKPGFTLIAVLTLALGIGATTAIFSVVNTVVLRPLPYPEPDRLAMVWMNNKRINVAEDWHSWPNYIDYRDQNKVFESIAAFNNRSFNLTGEGEPVRVVGAWGTANLFPTLGVNPILGRGFTVEEEEQGKGSVVVLGYGLWQRQFGGDPQVVGKTISLNGAPRTVIGVMPAGFNFPRKETEIWIPVSLNQQNRQQRGGFWIQAIGRLKPGVTVRQAQAEMSGIADRLQQQYPDMLRGYGANIVGYQEQVVGSVKLALWLLLGAVGFVLLIACVNVANLLLGSAAAREREIAVRTAIGAGRARLVRQLLTESAVLALLGGAAGVLLAVWGLNALIALGPQDIPRLSQAPLDGRVLGFALTVSLLTGLIFGLLPALQASKPDLNETLKEGGRGTTASRQGRRIRQSLVVAEVAIALVLLACAGLMIKSFLRLQQVNVGFNPDNLLTMRIQLSGERYGQGQGAGAVNFYQQLIQRVESLPGVQGVGAISDIFLSQTPNSSNFSIEGRPDFKPEERIETPVDVVSPNYFRVVGTALVSGRWFDERDGSQTTPVVIINETMARRFWPNEDPLGKRIKYGGQGSNDPWKTIVGVVADARRTGFEHEVRCETFLPHAQSPSRGMTLVARSTTRPEALAASVRQAVRELDKDQPVYDIRPMAAMLGEMVARRRLNMLLFGLFAGVALLLAGVGIYGVMSTAVTQRSHEIGVRLALGARAADVLKLVVREGMTLAVIGVVIGLAVALLVTRLMTSLLYGVSATDPATFVLIALLLTAVALVACWIPARRATMVDPMVALRVE
jgi:putative ABC transport system permease protein